MKCSANDLKAGLSRICGAPGFWTQALELLWDALF